MATDVKVLLGRGKEMAARLTPVQKIALGAALITMIAGAFVLSRTGSATQMSPLFTDLEAADASAVVDQLTAQGVAYELTDAGHTVMVPKTDVYDLRLTMAAQGLPTSNSQGYALLDQQGITTSEFRQRIDYQRALEGELSNTLKAMDGVRSATVHLALPEESVFVDEPMHPTASVMISTQSTAGVSDDQVQAIVHLVSSAVKNMQPADVTVIDASGTVLSAPGVSGGGGASGRTKEQSAYEQKVAASILAMLSRTTGADKVAVTVTADLDLDAKQSTSEDFGPIGTDESGGEVVAEQTNIEIYGPDAANGTTGILGPDGATITSTVPANVAEGGFASADSDKSYAVDRVVEQVTNAPGAVKKLNVAVVVDEAAVTDAQASQIEELVATAAGIDTARGDQLTVTRLPFDTSAVTEADEAAKVEAAAAAKDRMMELIRTGAVAFLILIALVLAYRSTRKARKITATPIDIGEITAGKPGGSAAELTSAATTTLDPVGARAVGGARANELMSALEGKDSPMTEIAEIAESRPEEVANILRAWLNEAKAGRR